MATGKKQKYTKACERNSLSNAATADDNEPAKHQNNIGINEEQINLLLEKTSTVMSNIQYITQPDFSIDNLVELVGSNKRYVSWVINDRYGKSFNKAFKKTMGMTPSAYQRLRMQTDCENNDSPKDNDKI